MKITTFGCIGLFLIPLYLSAADDSSIKFSINVPENSSAICNVTDNNPNNSRNSFTDSLDSVFMPDIWTYADCVDWASSRSTDIRRALLDILTARQDILSSKDEWLPTVGFSTNQNFTNYPISNPGRNKSNSYGSSYSVGVNWTAWDGNARKYRIESAKLLERQKILAGDDVLMNLKLGILESYLNILYSQEAVQIAAQTLEVSTTQAERAKRLMESGRSSRVDYAQIESQRTQDAYNLTQAEGTYQSAKLALKKILQLSLDYNLNISEVSFPDSEVISPLPDSATVYHTAASWLPSIKSNELNRDIYDNDVKLAKTGMLPTIGVQGGVGTGYNSGGYPWGKQMGYNFNENIGVNLNIPIFDANATKRAVAKANLASLQYDLTRQDLLNNLSQTIENLYIDANNAHARYEAGLSQLEAAQLTDQLANRQFELGLVNPLELLTAHNNLLNSRLELLQSKYMAILASKTINYYLTQEIRL